MALTANTLLQLIQRRSVSLPASGERRLAGRSTLWEKVSIIVSSQPQRAMDAYLRDASAEGLGVICSRPLLLGEELELVLQDQDPPMQRFTARVVACRRLGQNLYGVGAQFTPQTLGILASWPRSTAA